MPKQAATRNSLSSLKEIAAICVTHFLLQGIPKDKKGLKFHTRNIPSFTSLHFATAAGTRLSMCYVQCLEGPQLYLQMHNLVTVHPKQQTPHPGQEEGLFPRVWLNMSPIKITRNFHPQHFNLSIKAIFPFNSKS